MFSSEFFSVNREISQRRARLRHLARHLHQLSERPVYELLRELDAGADLLDALERYRTLDPSVVRALGGDRLPRPIVLAGGQGT